MSCISAFYSLRRPTIYEEPYEKVNSKQENVIAEMPTKWIYCVGSDLGRIG